MELATSPTCPACGFRVFNRRYPKCESCGAELPDSIAYTAVERSALIAAEDQQARTKADEQDHFQAAKASGIESAMLVAVLGATTIASGGS
jgi:predicted RNA-binding Zn-ribbon protein involved in translation (DUF1610 family)